MKTSHSFIRSLFVVAALSCFALSPNVQGTGGPPGNCNTSEGHQALSNVTTGFSDSAFGGSALFSDTTGSNNTATGCAALFNNETGSHNTATGFGALRNNVEDENTAFGSQALYSNITGRRNTAVGRQALFSNTFVSSDNTAVGFQALYSNGGPANTAVGSGALFSNIGGLNTAIGSGALFSNTTGSHNTADGAGALESNTTGDYNTAVAALGNNTTGANNTAMGFAALEMNRTGSDNVAIGAGALFNSRGDGNIGLGVGAGDYVSTGNDVICIGQVHGANVDRTCFIGNIRGVTTINDNAIPVVIDGSNQLGTISSARRFKKEIKPMDKASEAILSLKPVTFHYKNSKKGTPQCGLIAEDVAKMNPDLVVRDKDGEIYTVRYDAVNAMLLNEFLKEHRKVQEQQASIAELKSTVAQQQDRFGQQEVQIQALASDLQKVRTRLEMRKSTTKLVTNGR